MRRLAVVFAGVFVLWALVFCARGLSLPGLGGGRVANPVKVRAVVSASPLVAGTEAEVAVEVRIDPRYHIQSSYAPKPNVAAQFTKLAAPGGITFGEIRYPKPKDIPLPGGVAGTQSVYDGRVYFLIPLKISADAGAGEGSLEISLETQACDEKSCDEPQTAVLKIPVTIAAAGAHQTPGDAEVFAAAHQQEFAAAAPVSQPPASTTASQALPEPAPTASGPGHAVALFSVAEEQSLIAGRDYVPANAAEQQHSLAAIFFFALLGGLILNVMPCVLPVIPLKALSLVQQAHGDRRVAVLHGLVFSAGIVTLFVALAILLRGFGMFYGQQFQSTAFLIAMTYLVVALALSMLGVWTINPPQAIYAADARISDAGRRSGVLEYAGVAASSAHGGGATYLASFGNGLLATLLATPCSAPFLGAVLAWALVQPTWIAAFTLGIVGVGMGLPYLLLAAFPGVLARFPRAGRWSELLKQGLGILMLFVAVYLATLVRDVHVWPWVLAGGLVVALVCWGWGQIPSPVMAAARIWTIRGIVLVVGLFLGAGVWKIGASVAATQDAMATAPAADAVFLADGPSDAWLPFNVALLDEALREGRPVVVDWTADWCINCRVLEATVLADGSVKGVFRMKNAVLLRADVSGASPAEWALLRKLGFESIPVAAIFQPADPLHPIVLPDLYTSTQIIGDVTAAR